MRKTGDSYNLNTLLDGYENKARHTFATCSIGLGMREEIIARILGHVDNKSVKEYARIEDYVKETEMEKWN